MGMFSGFVQAAKLGGGNAQQGEARQEAPDDSATARWEEDRDVYILVRYLDRPADR